LFGFDLVGFPFEFDDADHITAGEEEVGESGVALDGCRPPA
jgi:hypothetical protein